MVGKKLDLRALVEVKVAEPWRRAADENQPDDSSRRQQNMDEAVKDQIHGQPRNRSTLVFTVNMSTQNWIRTGLKTNQKLLLLRRREPDWIR